MALQQGTRLGAYEIISPLGAGCMGEVYRARDTKLQRDVALKILPETMARDAQRMARFEREAQVLASLNHPNIAAIYGLEESNGVRALVMELVEGQTLGECISAAPGFSPASAGLKTGSTTGERRSGIGEGWALPRERGALPYEDALPIARQIAEALEYAHERGVIHRDLKPANVKITPEGTVKVLDFGLAKVLETQDSTATMDMANSPTLSAMATQAGMILGTAAYMSPEQAKGQRVDRRADIWAFGCVLYEMLTGRKPFEGETISDVLAPVIKSEPDWDAIPYTTARSIQRLVRRCLQKDQRQRLQAIGEARITIEETIAGTDAVAAGFTRPPGPEPGGNWRRKAAPTPRPAVGYWAARGCVDIRFRGLETCCAAATKVSRFLLHSSAAQHNISFIWFWRWTGGGCSQWQAVGVFGHG
jgi:eukaryotic-like serine/threonine-protein kinase